MSLTTRGNLKSSLVSAAQVPLLTIWFGIFPIVINWWAALGLSVYYVATTAVGRQFLLSLSLIGVACAEPTACNTLAAYGTSCGLALASTWVAIFQCFDSCSSRF